LGTGLHRNYTLRVFNRWGQMVFSSLQQYSGWDGMANGMPQETGTYYYHIQYECSNGQLYKLSGDVQLIR
jgi:gliding motility-associated-like protein